MATSREIHDHQTWLGYLQPDGLVVSPAAMVDSGLNYDRNARPLQEDLLDHLREDQGWDEIDAPVLRDLPAFLTGFLQWPTEALLSGDDIPVELGVFLPEYQETLRPTHAIRDLRVDPDTETESGEPVSAADATLMLITELEQGTPLDKPTSESDRGWETTPSKRFERLLRESGVGIGLLSNGTHLRLVYAPPGENPGSLTFPVAAMAEVTGRPILGGFHLLLEDYRVFTAPEKETFAALLKKSRDFQANVSTELARQVLDGLYELLRGLQAANARTDGRLLERELAESPQTVYEAMLNVLMRLVFLLFAEDRGLMPGTSLYEQNYALHSLHDQLRSDRERYPDTMDQRYGSWARLLALFRLVYDGSRHRDMKMPARYGYLFDPDRFPFLEGIRDGVGESGKNRLPLIPDSTVFTVLDKLLYLGGERVSYRTLDVEQIGSVYETMMGFQLEVATGPTIAIKPKKKHGAAANVNLTKFLAIPAKDRKKRFKELTDRDLTGKRLTALKEAETQEDLLAVFDHQSERSSLIARNATPTVAHDGALLLQPSEARRKSGSHYTPRKLTEPIVRKALEPILANLTGDDQTGSSQSPNPVESPDQEGLKTENFELNTPETPTKSVPFPQQILDLKICDPAVGSGAFLVEACRQLGDELVKAWAAHGGRPQVPDDEDEVLLARRLVAQRCLYGVDRNPMAADLAKLSLWLATLAKDHPFTFLAHAIRSGDALVGLSKEQILKFHWDTRHASAQQMAFGQDVLEKKLKSALAYRQEILQAGDYVLPEMKAEQLRLADDALEPIRRAGDLAILAFFSESKKNARQEAREQMLERWQLANDQSGSPESLREGLKLKGEIRAAKEAEKPVRPFHWEIEFPEVFERGNPGFDCFVGNPPFLGGKRISGVSGKPYSEWLIASNPETNGNVDLVAHFFRRAFELLANRGSYGLISTKTIAQGDTRRGGLRAIRRRSGFIYSAIRLLKWPGEAAVSVSVVWIRKSADWSPVILDGQAVEKITAFLLGKGGDEDPEKLSMSKGLAFIGCDLKGQGFLFADGDPAANSHELRNKLIKSNKENSKRIFPFLGGEEISDLPAFLPTRFAIDFREMSEEKAGQWPELLEVVKSKVPIERASKSSSLGDYPWWIYWRPRRELYEKIADFERVIVCAQTAKHNRFQFYSPETVFSHYTIVFAIDSYSGISILESQSHSAWVSTFSSTLEDRQRYIPSDCFETFPFPTDWETNETLETIGRAYYDFRAEVMIRNDEGLTKTYNRFHDPGETMPDILRLRELHAEMDRAVLDAYGWTDIPTDCEFLLDYEIDEEEWGNRKKPYRYRWPDEIRGEVLARLLELNAARAAEESHAGTTPTASPPGVRGASKARRSGRRRSERTHAVVE
ncbi:MAG: hypothetical protein MI807_02675, partial [Verrucomicrobiales bacterium]|nr:hypothetical protein [Verrucomicrobiales bacterium]